MEKEKIDEEINEKKLLQQMKMPSDAQLQMFQQIDKNEKVWICEFCESHNRLPETVVLPKIDNPCYILK